MASRLLLGLFFVTGFSCCKQSVSPTEYVKYVTDVKNGIVRTVVVDGMEYKGQYRTHEHIVLMESQGFRKKVNIQKRRKELEGTVWFNLSLSCTDKPISILRLGIKSQEEYDERLSYYLNRAMEDVRLIYGKDTLSPASYLFENNYNLTPQETMVLGFDLPNKTSYPVKDMRLSYYDRIFDNGLVNMTFFFNSIENIPNLNFE
jgi:hypothetical protein